MKNIEVSGFCQISKPKAKKILKSGGEVFACPSKLRPGPPWSPEMMIHTDDMDDFEKTLTSIEYYNCSYETGKYLRFYVKNKENFCGKEN